MRRLLVCLVLLILPVAAGANDWAALEGPIAVMVMRHALAAPGTEDPASFDPEDCATQRNLDARGQEQAGQRGAA